MIKVYFENNISAQLVAIFTNEETYILCLPYLKKQAKNQGCFISETIETNCSNCNLELNNVCCPNCLNNL